MDQITIKDLYQYRFLSEVNPSPDGSKVLFTVSQAVEASNDYTSRLYCLDTATGAYKPITAKGKERSALWLDSDNILFTTATANAADSTTYFSLNLTGGEAVQAFTLPAKVGSIQQISEDLYLISTAKKLVDNTAQGEHVAQEGKDFLIFDEIPFWFNGKGVTNKVRNTLMLFSPSTGKLETVSPTYTNVEGLYLAPEKDKLLFWGANYAHEKPILSQLYQYHIGSRYTQCLVEPDQLEICFARYLGDTILFEGSDNRDNTSQEPLLYTVDSQGNWAELADLDSPLGSSSGSDMAYGGGRNMQVVGEDLYCLFTSWGNSYLSKLTATGHLSHVNQTVGSVSCFGIVGNTAYCVAMRDFAPQELYAIDLTTGAETKLTSFHDDFLASHQVVKPEHFTFTAPEGHVLEGWVLKPADYQPGQSYSGVLSMHGGPKVAFGTNYHHEMQVMAHQGHFVFYTNPRGASGRGEHFSRLVGKLGEIDFDDFMTVTDEVLRRYPDLDGNRLGVCGGSYGGFMTNWIIGNTNRFKAAAAQRSISNYMSKCLTTDIGYYHNLSQVGASPWDNVEKMWYHSPLKYVDNATTATLFIQSNEDYRCWMSEPLQMFTALRQKGIPAKMALFHGENHELSRSGKPHNRVGRLTEICGWFADYLK